MDKDFGPQTTNDSNKLSATPPPPPPPYPPTTIQTEDTTPTVSGDRVIYRPSTESHFKETRALFIGNLGMEMDTEKFKNILIEHAKITACVIERAWLNSNRSHCYVLTNGKSGAISIRDRLNGCDSNTLEKLDESKQQSSFEVENDDFNQQHNLDTMKIFIDFVPVKALNNWIESERDSPPDAIWQLTYELAPSILREGTEFQKVNHLMTNYPNTSSGYIRGKLNGNPKRHGKSQELFRYEGKKTHMPIPYDKFNSRSRDSFRGDGRYQEDDYDDNNENYHKDYQSRFHRRDDYRDRPKTGRIGKRRSHSRRGRNERSSDVYVPDY
ncbi:hypothetical protein C6P40_001171 [Pichia californica]|uniref:RRM domain-containing protein n=1 Tax=Pichia californica TaxID=460514 RepID=A0A9P6WJF0_9ASCO|nr:hypothetical protein C6P42_003961 [[Candida] californica]KAG0688284.1 hypothetical protein C6P40_001171 [[Candida] californica]